ncbi:MAG: hypothetical protein AB7Q00_14465 [Phycisphaerales bacterium]
MAKKVRTPPSDLEVQIASLRAKREEEHRQINIHKGVAQELTRQINELEAQLPRGRTSRHKGVGVEAHVILPKR